MLEAIFLAVPLCLFSYIVVRHLYRGVVMERVFTKHEQKAICHAEKKFKKPVCLVRPVPRNEPTPEPMPDPWSES